MGKQNIAIIQARINSTRLPNKVLTQLAGREMLYHIYERLSCVDNLDKIVIATTDHQADYPIVELGKKYGIEVYSHHGDVNDLLGRYIACGEKYDADIIVMIDGDCPLIHPPTIKRMVEQLKNNTSAEFCDISGGTIEGGAATLRLTTYKKMQKLATDPAHHEHATLFLAENPEMFTTTSVEGEKELCGIQHRLWLDTPSDQRFLTEIYQRFYSPSNIVDLHKVVDLLRKDEKLRSINAHVTQKDVRADNPPIILITEEHDKIDNTKIIDIANRLIDIYNASVSILVTNASLWSNSPVPVITQFPSKSHYRVQLTKNTLLFKTLPDESENTISIGLLSSATSYLGDVIACYFGFKSTKKGFFSPPDKNIIPIQIPCPLCGNNNIEEIWQKNDIVNGLCLNCGHVFLTKRWPSHIIENYYQIYQQTYPTEDLIHHDCPLLHRAQLYHKTISQQIKTPIKSILEIGSAYGNFLNLYKNTTNTVAIEPSKIEAHFALKHYNLPEVWQSSYNRLDELDLPKQKFDLIFSSHVIEHLENPRSLIRYAKTKLSPNGHLCLSMPNLFSLMQDFMEIYFIYHNFHLHTFSPFSITQLLNQEGFEITFIEDHPVNPATSSNMIVIAKLSNEKPTNNLDTSIESIKDAIQSFHNELDIKIKNVSDEFHKWHHANKTIVIYGGGLHTRALLELTDINPKSIYAIIDDDPQKHNTTLFNIPIQPLEKILDEKIDIIVASSLAAEEKMLSFLNATVPDNTQVFGIYKHLMLKG